MSYKRQIGVAMCMALGATLAGCPADGGPVLLGSYKIFFDDDCDTADDSVHMLIIYTGGNLEYISDGVERTGQWSLDGSTFSLTIFDFFGSDDLHGTATVRANSLMDGMYMLDSIVVVEGCFRAAKPAF